MGNQLSASLIRSAQAPSKAVALRPGARTVGALKMQAEGTSPINIFEGMDADGQDVKSSAFLMESEVKHGRLAMLAAVGWPVAELLHPFLAEASGFPSLLTDAGQVPSVLNGGLDKIADFSRWNLLPAFCPWPRILPRDRRPAPAQQLPQQKPQGNVPV